MAGVAGGSASALDVVAAHQLRDACALQAALRAAGGAPARRGSGGAQRGRGAAGGGKHGGGQLSGCRQLLDVIAAAQELAAHKDIGHSGVAQLVLERAVDGGAAGQRVEL